MIELLITYNFCYTFDGDALENIMTYFPLIINLIVRLADFRMQTTMSKLKKKSKRNMQEKQFIQDISCHYNKKTVLDVT